MVDRTSMVVTSHITRQLTSRHCRFNREAEIANRRQVWSCRGGQRGRCRCRAAGLSSCQGAFVAASRPRRRVGEGLCFILHVVTTMKPCQINDGNVSAVKKGDNRSNILSPKYLHFIKVVNIVRSQHNHISTSWRRPHLLRNRNTINHHQSQLIAHVHYASSYYHNTCLARRNTRKIYHALVISAVVTKLQRDASNRRNQTSSSVERVILE